MVLWFYCYVGLWKAGTCPAAAFLECVRYVFHFVVMIEYVNAGVGQTEVGVELGVGGIEQVGEQSQFVFIAVAYQPVVLVGQFHV